MSNDLGFLEPQRAARCDLPMPTRTRWQPLRLGLVELFHYDSEEFWFRDGHLLLRGNNGTGKSKVLSLTLPFLLDAQLTSSRIEPDGDRGKRMSWNLLMGVHPRRVGYAWIEFGRLSENGTAHYLTLGAGLSAVETRPHVESWYFIIDDDADAPRIGQSLWLVSEAGTVLTREKLRERLQGHGQLFENARTYRRVVDERLFKLGPQRYDALMDTLIQLRQPQLSKQPDERRISDALSEALPPLATELIADIAEAMGQLEEDRRQLEEYRELARTIGRFEQRYRIYAGTLSRRQARLLRRAQSEFDSTSQQRNETQALLARAVAEEEAAKAAGGEAELALAAADARYETLRSDPRNQDANRLETAERDMEARRRARDNVRQDVENANRRLATEAAEARQAKTGLDQASGQLIGLQSLALAHADAARIGNRTAAHPLLVAGLDVLASFGDGAFEAATAELQRHASERREHIKLLRRRHEAADAAQAQLARRQETLDERREATEAALEQSMAADAACEREGQALIQAWDEHFAGLRVIAVPREAREQAIADMSGWVASLDGPPPARARLQQAQSEAVRRMADEGAALTARRHAVEAERTALGAERTALEAGIDAIPPAPYTRATDARAGRRGAALWQVIDFHDSVGPEHRCGIEAALEAAGLLDAWVTPDGALEAKSGETVRWDTQVTARSSGATSLAAWLRVALPDDCNLAAPMVADILAGIACSDDDEGAAETWVSPAGRFRLGALAGAWSKPEPAYIGYAARAASRARRLAAIAEALGLLDDELTRLGREQAALRRNEALADEEWRSAPQEDTLRSAHAVAATAARAVQDVRRRHAEAETLLAQAEALARQARERLAADAADLDLPVEANALPAIEAAVDSYRDAQMKVGYAVRNLRSLAAGLTRQRVREEEAREALAQRQDMLENAEAQAEEAAARFDALREALGATVDDLRRSLTEARAAVDTLKLRQREALAALGSAGQTRAVAASRNEFVEAAWVEKNAARSDAVGALQRFASSGLLAAGWPEVELPESWTIGPALALARQAEQALEALADDDETWERVQKAVSADYTALQTSLSALRHQAQAEQTEWGMVVFVLYQNRLERPDRLAARLAEEITQRDELLTAKERELLENHLQAEIAAELQRLVQAAEIQRLAINAELHKRPTTTGVRYRLQWQPLAEEDGAPAGLEAARKRLLNTNADLWTAEDRALVGDMLSACIAAERVNDSGGSLVEQLRRALDYRRWHRFRIERLQDDQWRKLSAPASSGERALGLTVPLFAAVASFYGQAQQSIAPRLILLDEAFAGIDDASRAHCMAMIREFDLDFVMTSEREWACYADLPGVSICQLQRKEGIDAVFVSRWTWDGKSRSREADPERRMPAA